MQNIWSSLALMLIALITSLLGVYKDAFLPGRVPRWFFFALACLPVVAAVINVYQIFQSRKIENGAEKLASNVTPESAPLRLTMDQKQLLMNMINKISSVEPGKSKLFTAPDVSSGTFYNLGLLFFNQRDFLQAEKYLKASIKADKNNIPAINLLLQLYQSAAMNHLSDREIGAAESALAKAEKLIGTLPAGTNLGTLTLLAYVYKSLGQVKEGNDPQMSKQYWDKAGKIFETVLISSKNDPGALNGLGNVLHHKQQFREAFEKYKKALEIAPNYTAAANDAAIVCENLMHHEADKNFWKNEAVKYWQIAVQLSENDPQFPPEYGPKISGRIDWLKNQ